MRKSWRGIRQRSFKHHLQDYVKSIFTLRLWRTHAQKRLCLENIQSWRWNPELESRVLMGSHMRHGRCSSPESSRKAQERAGSYFEEIIISSRRVLLCLWNLNWYLSHRLTTFLSQHCSKDNSGPSLTRELGGLISTFLQSAVCLFSSSGDRLMTNSQNLSWREGYSNYQNPSLERC